LNLIFGFEDIAYSARLDEAVSPLSVRRRRGQKKLSRSQQVYGAGKSTAQVAQELEARYGIVATFAEMEQDTIANILSEYVAEEVVHYVDGSTPTPTVPDQALKRIERKFQLNLSQRKYDGRISGVPTWAARRGYQHQFARPYSKSHGPRPSFVDTGMYQMTFRVWVEGQDRGFVAVGGDEFGGEE
jgi:hypothetical protein